MASKPNVIVIMADTVTTGALGCYGAPYIRTPNLDRLAAQATIFEQAYQPATMCQPSRISWMTGCYPARHGIYVNAYKKYERKERTLLRAAHEAGYKGGYLGIFHCWSQLDRDGLDDWSWVDWLFDFPHADYVPTAEHPKHLAEFLRHLEAMGVYRTQDHLKDFHHHAGHTDFPIEHHIATRLTDKALLCIDDFASDRPNFLWTSYWMPHEPWAPPDPWHRMYKPEDVVLPGNLRDSCDTRPLHHRTCEDARTFRQLWTEGELSFRRVMAAYAGCMSFVDHNIGRIIDHLKRRNLYDDSLIVFLTDHGTASGAHGILYKGDSYMIDEISRIPLFVKLPRQREGKRVREIVSSVDLYPTMLKHLGIAHAPVDGRILPGLGGAELGSDAVALGQHNDGIDDNAESVRMLRKGPWKYNLYSKTGVEELYDLDADPLELRNIASIAQPQRDALRSELIGRIRASGDSFMVR